MSAKTEGKSAATDFSAAFQARAAVAASIGGPNEPPSDTGPEAEALWEAEEKSIATQRRELPDHPGLVAAHIAALTRLGKPIPAELSRRSPSDAFATHGVEQALRRLNALGGNARAVDDPADLPSIPRPPGPLPPVVLPRLARQDELRHRAATGAYIPLHNAEFDDCVLVFQMGKVGSQAVCEALSGVGIRPRHCHWLSELALNFIRKRHSAQFVAGYPVALDFGISLLEYERYRACLADHHYARLIKVVTLVREPLSLILSHYFNDFSGFSSQVEAEFGEIRPGTVAAHLHELATEFLSMKDLTHRALLEPGRAGRNDFIHFAMIVRNAHFWFVEELEPIFDIDVYSYPIRPPCIIENVAILKTESLARESGAMLAAFVRRPELQIAPVNARTDTPDGELYRAVARLKPFPEQFVRVIHGSRYARHFYSAAELDLAARRFTAVDASEPAGLGLLPAADG